jgi:predicted dehydrogenase
VKVGVVGAGVISRAYAKNAQAFDSFDLVACADLDAAQAESLAEAHGLRVTAVPEILSDPEIDVVLNLTPASAHGVVSRQILEAGKHLYTEKPLAVDLCEAAELVRQADGAGVRVGCAPDIFLGSAYQSARALIDQGAIGEPLSVSAAMLVGGQERWHPNPDIFYVDGAGPLFDMGPYYLTAIAALLGPIRRVAGFASMRGTSRVIEIGPRAGERFSASTPTHVSATMELESGVTANLITSFEAAGQYVCDLEIHGSEGVLGLPDPNSFGGSVRIRRVRGAWEDVPYVGFGGRDARGIGLHDMVQAIDEERDHRASGRLGLHIVAVARGILQSAHEGRVVDIETSLEKPAPLPVAPAA